LPRERPYEPGGGDAGDGDRDDVLHGYQPSQVPIWYVAKAASQASSVM
jgi:hypothetical protein